MIEQVQHHSSPDRVNHQRVLLAEDSPEASEVITILLEGLGFSVTTVADGRECMDAVKRAEKEGSPFDLVFIDIRMPLVDGNEAAVALRTTGYQNPLIAITADASLAGKLESTFSGFDAYLSKRGLDQGLLAQVVKEVAARGRSSI
jgi:CheY-like chemotaxis protein